MNSYKRYNKASRNRKMSYKKTKKNFSLLESKLNQKGKI